LKYTSHLDLARLWERIIRRAGLPVIYSQGFNPRPKIQLAAALPLGYESKCEILDVWVEGVLPAHINVTDLIQKSAPPGLIITRIISVNDRGPALQSITRSSVYEVALDPDITHSNLSERLIDMLKADAIIVQRNKKTLNIRDKLLDVRVIEFAPLTLSMELTLSQEEGSARPDDVLQALGIDLNQARITRIALHFTGEIEESYEEA
jgi:radical SAM-linked protein